MRWVRRNQQVKQPDGTFQDWFAGHLKEPEPRGIDTPEGFYHNEQGVRSTLEERYFGHLGAPVPHDSPNESK